MSSVDLDTRRDELPCVPAHDECTGEPEAKERRAGRLRSRWAVGLALGVLTLGVVYLVARRHSRRRAPCLAKGFDQTSSRPPLEWRWQWLRYRLGASAMPNDLRGVLAALRRPPVPRAVPFVEVKRRDPRVGRSYGHWWVELDGAESYGWWPRSCPVSLRQVLAGGTGTLNGMGGSCRGGGLTRDPHHLDRADQCLRPTLVVRKSDRRLRADIRAFAHAYRGEWRWSMRPGAQNCRSFQLDLLAATGLHEGTENLSTWGRGCPFMSFLRALGRAALSGWQNIWSRSGEFGGGVRQD